MSATQPSEIHELFQAAFNAHDLPAILALYELDALFVTGSGTSVSGHDALAAVFEAFFAMKPVMRLETASVFQNGDLAMLEGKWVLLGAGPEGDPVQITGTSQEVVRRQSDGRWLYTIDNPGSGR
jgi:uncharacterized protein (TIGR02246 family)